MIKSLKNKLKAAKKASATIPREAQPIRDDYAKRLAKAGELQYQISVLTEELDQLNGEIKSLNYEFQARTDLDKQSQQETPAAEVSNG